MSNLSKALKAAHPEDVAQLRREISMLMRFSDTEIESLYESFSADWCASWLIVGQETLTQFTQWLEE